MYSTGENNVALSHFENNVPNFHPNAVHSRFRTNFHPNTT